MPTETAKRRQRIEALADQVDALAEGARDGLVEYRQFETIPDGELISAVAKSLLDG